MCCLVGLCQMPILGKLFCSTSTRQLPGTAGLHLPALQGSMDPLTTQRLQLAFSASQPLCQTLTGATTHSFYFLILKTAQRASGRQETNKYKQKQALSRQVSAETQTDPELAPHEGNPILPHTFSTTVYFSFFSDCLEYCPLAEVSFSSGPSGDESPLH